MGIKTSEEAKGLFDKAMGLSEEDITILGEIHSSGSLSAVRVAGSLLISPNNASDKLSQLQEKGLITNIQRAKREIFVSEEEQYFTLSDEGEEMMTILPIVEKMRGAL